MIETISLRSVATYSDTPEVLGKLSQFNFVYGPNGCGKTTISRVIANAAAFPSCSLTWKNGTPLQTMTYNRDFVEANFSHSAELKGVFTLGEKHVDTLKKITKAKEELDSLKSKLQNLNRTLKGDDGLGGKVDELAVNETALKDRCWAQKQKHDKKLQGAFEGFRGSAERFKTKILQESTSNKAEAHTLADLEKRAETLFGPAPTPEVEIAPIDSAELLAHESNSILKKRVIGKDDVDIAAMIKALGNSDWVREGRSFFDVDPSVCPFCQQKIPASFATSLNEYFDKTFGRDSRGIDSLSTSFSADAERVQKQLTTIIATPPKFLDLEKLKLEQELLDSRLKISIARIAEKKKEPSRVIELEPLKNVLTAIDGVIGEANKQTAAHNSVVANLGSEKTKLTSQVWKYLLDQELSADLATYTTKRDSVQKAIAAIEGQIKLAVADISAKSTEIRELEKLTTSIQPTIDGINLLLKSFGFQGFSIAKADSGNSYKLVRADGSDAKTTLSEGEKTFVTFLYFYHLLKGSDSESGMTTDRVVVFDDPVSSLDSDILFIVGSLIKGLFNEVRDNIGHVKQVFVLTHNVYFHKEVTFNPKRVNDAMNEETFWIVRKSGLVSKIDQHASNPIKTSYELLWYEVRNPDRSNLSIQNTLRRILENYFKILGGIDSDKICEKFEGKEKLICRSLFSWVNDGSHYAHDDLYVSIDPTMVEGYLNVFKAVFEKLDHLAHYRMMMGDVA